MNAPLDVINTYFDLVQAFNTDPAEYAKVLHPEVEQIEYPNPIYRTIQRRTFHDIIDNLRAGREILKDPSFEVRHTSSSSDGSVLVEGRWQATIVSEIKGLVRGQQIAAQLCLIFEFKDGLIYQQRRYPCFEQL